ncbi:MAG: beta-propeller domain-containing protein [Labilithrix sp.]|nr:beta-propeller domain-containing protein [Labilithrix sp.]
MRLRFVFPFLAAAPLLSGCSAVESLLSADDGCAQSAALGEEEKEPGGIHGFTSEAELDAYIAGIEAKTRATQQGGSSGRCSEDAGMKAPNAAESAGDNAGSAAAPNEDITNNQEAGVDEGGIVKNIGDHLVVLRQGRLYVANVTDGRAPTLGDSMRVARVEGLNSNVWYDEMLVKGDLVYVIGFRYGITLSPAHADENVIGATEIDTFRLTDGKLTRLGSMFLESNDYYSGRNYASRMVDGKLVFYMPHYVGRRADNKLAYPRVLTADDAGSFSVVGPIFGALDVSTSLTKPHYPTFHTVVQCDLPDTGALACHGRSVIGSWWRESYVSPNAAYLWASSHVYRFDFASLDVSSHSATGHPLDQFSFRESQDKLLVAVSSGSPYSGAPQGSGPALLALPLASFDKQGAQPGTSTPLRDKGYIAKNRFVGDVLVAAVGDGYGYDGRQATSELVTLDAATGALQRTPTGPVARIEPLGDRRALVVTAADDGAGIKLTSLLVDAPGLPLSSVTLDGATEGEGRSHGFFFKPDANGGGTIGYAVISPPGYGAGPGWGNGISNLGFFDVGRSGSMSALGIVSAGDVAGTCETSCVDWYGNTRPIFLRQRAFALMGSELVEVTLRPTAKRLGDAVVLASSESSSQQ